MTNIKQINFRLIICFTLFSVLLCFLISCNNSKEESNPKEQILIPMINSTDFAWNNLTISANQVVKTDSNGINIELLIEKDSLNEYSISSAAVIINNGMTDATYESIARAKETLTDILHISFSDLEFAGIVNVGQVEMHFDIHNQATNESVVKGGVLSITLSEPSLPMISGHILYDQHGIKIYGQYVDETTVWDSSVLIYVQNNSDKNIFVSCEQVSVNDSNVIGTYNELIYANKHSVDNIPIPSTNMDINDIGISDSIILKMKIVDADTLEIVDVTDPISFRAN